MDKKIQADAAEIRNQYMRDWRQRNRDKVRAANKRYWEKKAEERAAAREAEQSADT